MMSLPLTIRVALVALHCLMEGALDSNTVSIYYTTYGFHCTNNNTLMHEAKSFASSRITLLLDKTDGNMKIDLCVIF